MSKEATKRKTAWLTWIGVICLAPIIYALSSGPALKIVGSVSNMHAALLVFHKVYYPLYWLAGQWAVFGDLLSWYLESWLPGSRFNFG